MEAATTTRGAQQAAPPPRLRERYASARVAALSSKFGCSSLAQLCELSELDVLVVDDQLSPEWRERITSAGVKLILANTTEQNGK